MTKWEHPLVGANTWNKPSPVGEDALEVVKQQPNATMLKLPEVKWQHPLIGANPYVMPGMWGMAIFKTLMEAHQKKVTKFMTTGVW